jgi:hypothetical protein
MVSSLFYFMPIKHIDCVGKEGLDMLAVYVLFLKIVNSTTFSDKFVDFIG